MMIGKFLTRMNMAFAQVELIRYAVGYNQAASRKDLEDDVIQSS